MSNLKLNKQVKLGRPSVELFSSVEYVNNKPTGEFRTIGGSVGFHERQHALWGIIELAVGAFNMELTKPGLHIYNKWTPQHLDGQIGWISEGFLRKATRGQLSDFKVLTIGDKNYSITWEIGFTTTPWLQMWSLSGNRLRISSAPKDEWKQKDGSVITSYPGNTKHSTVDEALSGVKICVDVTTRVRKDGTLSTYLQDIAKNWGLRIVEANTDEELQSIAHHLAQHKSAAKQAASTDVRIVREEAFRKSEEDAGLTPVVRLVPIKKVMVGELVYGEEDGEGVLPLKSLPPGFYQMKVGGRDSGFWNAFIVDDNAIKQLRACVAERGIDVLEPLRID